MTANISFLPMSAAKATLSALELARLTESEPAGERESTVYRLTSDPRYVLRIRQGRLPDGRRTRSTCILLRATGEVVDRLDLVSDDDGQRWQVAATGR